jgi:hypothetical protein
MSYLKLTSLINVTHLWYIIAKSDVLYRIIIVTKIDIKIDGDTNN